MRVAIVLAAGGSRRFGAANKLLASLDGSLLLCRALAAARAAPAARLIVVVGAQGARVAAAARRCDQRVRVVRARGHREGIGASLRAARDALWPIEHGAFVFLGDMPGVPHGLARRLTRAGGRRFDLVRPDYRGVPGHPVLVDAAYLKGVKLAGDRGLSAAMSRTCRIAAGKGCIADVDRVRDLASGRR